MACDPEEEALLLHLCSRKSFRAGNIFPGVGNQRGTRCDCSIYVDPAFHGRALSATVLLARHGSHDEVGAVLSGRSEIALNAAGRAEAERLADRLASAPLRAIHASPRRRTRETAEIVAACHGLPVTLVDALDEVDFGVWTGRSFDSLDGDPDWDHWNAERATASTPGGETMAAAVARATAHIASLEGDGGTTLCVSHCDIIRGVAAQVLGLSLDRLLAFDCAPGSLTTLALAHGRGRIVTLNEVPQ